MGVAADSRCGRDQTGQRPVMFLETIQRDRQGDDHMGLSQSDPLSYQITNGSVWRQNLNKVLIHVSSNYMYDLS